MATTGFGGGTFGIETGVFGAGGGVNVLVGNLGFDLPQHIMISFNYLIQQEVGKPLRISYKETIMPRKPKGIPRKGDPHADEKAPPKNEEQWLNSEKSGDPSDHVGMPKQLRGLSELDAIAWVLRNCKFAQQQYFDFYDPKEYQPVKSVQETQDQQFWNWVRTEGNPTRVNPIDALEGVLLDYPSYAQTFINTYASVYNPKAVEFPTGLRLNTLKINRKIFILDAGSIEDANTWLTNLNDMYLDEYYPPKDFNQEFWSGIGQGYVLYHATSNENLQSILKKGLRAENRTRGLSNRGMGNAVFTSPEPTSIDSYGDTVLEINVGAMKADGYMPSVSREEPFDAEEIKGAIAHRLGMEDWIGGEFGSEGLAEDTVAFFGPIPAKYLSVY